MSYFIPLLFYPSQLYSLSFGDLIIRTSNVINKPEVKVCTYIHTCKYINVHTHILQLPLQLARTIILLKVQPEIFHILLWSQNDSLLSRTNYIPTYFWFPPHFFLFWGFTLKFNFCNLGLYFYSFLITYLFFYKI